MSIATDLEKLAELRQSGVLNQEEFERAKVRLLEERPRFTRPPIDTEKLSPAFLNRLREAENDELAAAVLSKFNAQKFTQSIIAAVVLVILLILMLPLILP